MEMDDLFGIPGQGGPYHIDSIPCRTLVSAPIHPMITFEMADDWFDLDPLLQGFSEPGCLAVRMRGLPLLGNGDSCDAPPSAAVLLFPGGLIEPSISGDFPRRLSKVLLDSGDHPTQGVYIGNVALKLHMRQDQAVIILGEGNNGAKLTLGMTLALLDDGDVGLMQRIDPVLGGLAGENLFRLIDNFLSERDQTIDCPSRFLESSTVKTIRDSGSLLDHMAGHLFEFFDRLFPAFRVFPVELLDSEEEFLTGSDEGAKGFPKGYHLANPLDLFDDLLSNSVKKIGIRRIGDVLGLGSGIHRHPLGLHQSHARPSREQHGLYLFHPLSTDPFPELHKRCGFQNLTALEGVKSTEALPIGIFMKHLDGPFI
jgi:hypothetical protein